MGENSVRGGSGKGSRRVFLSQSLQLGQPHCAEHSELKTKIAVCVIRKDGPQAREQVVEMSCFSPEKLVHFYRSSTWRKRGLFVIHTMAPLVIAVAQISPITLLEL